MRATQGVILVMVGVLILYLIWSAKSPLNQPATNKPTPGTSPANPSPGNNRPADGQPVHTGT